MATDCGERRTILSIPNAHESVEYDFSFCVCSMERCMCSSQEVGDLEEGA